MRKKRFEWTWRWRWEEWGWFFVFVSFCWYQHSAFLFIAIRCQRKIINENWKCQTKWKIFKNELKREWESETEKRMKKLLWNSVCVRLSINLIHFFLSYFFLFFRMAHSFYFICIIHFEHHSFFFASASLSIAIIITITIFRFLYCPLVFQKFIL